MPITIIYKLLAVAALLAALFGAEQYIEGLGYSRAVAEYTTRIDAQKTTAAQTLAAETAKTRAAEQAVQDLINQQEIQDATHQKTVADLSGRLRVLAGSGGRLRDPNAVAGCGGGGSSPQAAAASDAGDRASDRAEAGGLLSEQLSGLLQRLTREADDINAAYISCRSGGAAVRARQNAQP